KLSRLFNQLAHCEKVAEHSSAVGRKLDFIKQEMHREANTIGSKSVDASISETIVSIKVILKKSKNKFKISSKRSGGIILALQLINIGFGNVVSANRIISIVSPESAPIKRIVQVARETNNLIDATYGRRTRAVIVTDSPYVVLSAVQPETVGQRVTRQEEMSDDKCRRKYGS